VCGALMRHGDAMCGAGCVSRGMSKKKSVFGIFFLGFWRQLGRLRVSTALSQLPSLRWYACRTVRPPRRDLVSPPTVSVPRVIAVTLHIISAMANAGPVALAARENETNFDSRVTVRSKTQIVGRTSEGAGRAHSSQVTATGSSQLVPARRPVRRRPGCGVGSHSRYSCTLLVLPPPPAIESLHSSTGYSVECTASAWREPPVRVRAPSPPTPMAHAPATGDTRDSRRFAPPTAPPGAPSRPDYDLIPPQRGTYCLGAQQSLRSCLIRGGCGSACALGS
jgi:hypothetical protein